MCYAIRDTQLFACVTCVRGAPLGGDAAHTALPPQSLLDLARGPHDGGKRPLPITDAAVLRDAIVVALTDLHALASEHSNRPQPKL